MIAGDSFRQALEVVTSFWATHHHHTKDLKSWAERRETSPFVRTLLSLGNLARPLRITTFPPARTDGRLLLQWLVCGWDGGRKANNLETLKNSKCKQDCKEERQTGFIERLSASQEFPTQSKHIHLSHSEEIRAAIMGWNIHQSAGDERMLYFILFPSK